MVRKNKLNTVKDGLDILLNKLHMKVGKAYMSKCIRCKPTPVCTFARCDWLKPQTSGILLAVSSPRALPFLPFVRCIQIVLRDELS